MIKYLLLIAAMMFTGVSFAEGLTEADFITISPKNDRANARLGSRLADLMRHRIQRDSSVQEVDRLQDIYDVSMRINQDLKSRYSTEEGRPVSVFYLMEDRGIVLPEPRLRGRDFSLESVVPPSLRGANFERISTNTTTQNPFYLWNMWVVYTNTATVALEMFEEGQLTCTEDDIKKMLSIIELVVYSIAFVEAIKEADTEYYYDNYIKFINFFKWQLERSLDIYSKVKDTPEFKSEEINAFHQNFLTSSDAEPMRRSLRRLFGAEWAQRVMGF